MYQEQRHRYATLKAQRTPTPEIVKLAQKIDQKDNHRDHLFHVIVVPKIIYLVSHTSMQIPREYAQRAAYSRR